jgi:hypothetical protein
VGIFRFIDNFIVECRAKEGKLKYVETKEAFMNVLLFCGVQAGSDLQLSSQAHTAYLR